MAGASTRHFVHQRATALVQIPLVLWLVVSLIRHAGDNHAEFMAWVSKPLTAGLLSTFVLIVGYHMRLGMDEVINDYIHKPGSRSFFLGLNLAVSLILAVGSFFSIIAITLIA